MNREVVFKDNSWEDTKKLLSFQQIITIMIRRSATVIDIWTLPSDLGILTRCFYCTEPHQESDTDRIH
jgi:hypothetical protein